MKFKLRHVGWFFQFIWSCIKDLRYHVDCVNEIGLFKENWEDFKTRIYFDTDPEGIALMNRITEALNERKND